MGSFKISRLNVENFGHQVDNSKSTIQKLYRLYCDPVLSDLQLFVGENTFFAHKLILSISSDVFKTMLTSPTWPEAYTDKIYLEEEPQCNLVFEDFLQYLYTGKIHLSHTHVLPVLILADKYNIGDLSAVCVDYMCKHSIAPKSESSILSWLNYSMMCNHKNLEKSCESYINSNFQYILETDEFLTISSDMLLRFLKSSEIVVMNEMSLFQFVLKWVEKNIVPTMENETCTPDNICMLKNIVSTIRQSLISRDDLISLQTSTKQAIARLNNLTGINCLPQEPSEMINQTIHSDCGSHGELAKATMHKEVKENSCPRIYTCDSWCTEMMIPNVREIQPGEIYGAFFSTPSSPSVDNEESWDWHIDLYPRGVLFRGCMMIGHYGNHSIDEVIYERVRLAITSNTPECRSVKVTVLIYGQQNGVEYVARAVTKTCLFNEDHIIYHVNDLIPFNELENEQSPFLLGDGRDSFKIKIIIIPVSSSYIKFNW